MPSNNQIVYLGGNNYNYKVVKPFIRFLKFYFDNVIYIELLENIYSDLPYSRLSPEAYNHYIFNKLPDPDAQYVFFGTSMGCYHIQNFATENPNLVKAIVWLEPTMCGGDYRLLKEFEAGRGNGDWLRELFVNVEPNQSFQSAEKVIDIAVSKGDMELFSRNIPLGIIFTSRDLEDRPYNPQQLAAKNAFLNRLKDEGYAYKFMQLDSIHTADLRPEHFKDIVKFISFVCADSI